MWKLEKVAVLQQLQLNVANGSGKSGFCCILFYSNAIIYDNSLDSHLTS